MSATTPRNSTPTPPMQKATPMATAIKKMLKDKELNDAKQQSV